MQISEEIRWFWRDSLSCERFVQWFRSPDCSVEQFEAGGGLPREDRYLLDPEQRELGIKLRGGRAAVEIKGLVRSAATVISIPPFSGTSEIWCKWPSSALSIPADRQFSIHKTRWIRKLITEDKVVEVELAADEMPVSGEVIANGCNLEFTRIRLADGANWCTLSFEAFGELAKLSTNLSLAVEWLALRNPPELEAQDSASYPAWLARVSTYSLNGHP